MTVMPQGGTNSVQAFQAAVVKIFQELIPTNVAPFIDDIPVKPSTRTKDCTLVRPGIRKFVYDFALVVARVLELAVASGITLSCKKTIIGVPSITIVGHLCDSAGRRPGSVKL
jgi:hypothetical protein